MFTEKKTKSTLSKALALGMVATSVSLGAQTATADAAKNENTNTTSTYKTQTSTKTGTVTVYALNIRKGPSTSYERIGSLTEGQKVTVTSTASNGWYKIKTSSGKVGYVSPKYLKVSTTEADKDDKYDNENTHKGTYVVKTYAKISKVGKVSVSSLNLRTGPSTSYSKKGSLHKGYVVGIVKQYSNGWYQVKLKNGTKGCVDGSYLKITSGTSSVLKNGSSLSTGKEDNDGGTVSSSRVQAVINMVKRQVGKPYVYGAAGPNSFDCSGLTYYCYKNAAGITLNRSSAAQASNGRYVSKSELKPGDLVFFNSGTNRIHHVGMYVGNGQFIHAPSPGKSVKYENLYSSYYVKGYVTARRIIG